MHDCGKIEGQVAKLQEERDAALLKVKTEHSDSLQHHHAWMCEMELRRDREEKLAAAILRAEGSENLIRERNKQLAEVASNLEDVKLQNEQLRAEVKTLKSTNFIRLRADLQEKELLISELRKQIADPHAALVTCEAKFKALADERDSTVRLNGELVEALKAFLAVDGGGFETRHAAENSYCPDCANESDSWRDQTEHHAGCGYLARIEAAKAAISKTTIPTASEKRNRVCDRCKKEFNDNDSNWCLACRRESESRLT